MSGRIRVITGMSEREMRELDANSRKLLEAMYRVEKERSAIFRKALSKISACAVSKPYYQVARDALDEGDKLP